LLAGFNVKAEPVSGDKETRASPLAAQVNAGNVRFVRGPWNKEVIEQMRQFPMGKHDDHVDGMSDAFNELASSKRAGISPKPARRSFI
jgi:predicted phage terminase large subunit-like protein